MRIAIMSDSHDNIPNMEKALKYINEQGINFIIHCGDLAAPAMLSEVIIPNFKGQLHLVYGNVGDPDLLEQMAKSYKNVKVHGDRGEVEVEGKKIGFCHFPDEAKRMAETGQFNIVFYGHTHRPWEEKIIANRISRIANRKEQNDKLSAISDKQEVKIVNPGTLAGMFYKATFAIYDTSNDKLELKILETIK